jgi:glycosyltransferase involved in cell wall biosynthesis
MDRGTLILYGTDLHMPALRVLHVVPYFEDAWAYGGIPRVATAVAYGLAARGHRVTVCTTDACDESARAARRRESPLSMAPDVRVFPNVSNRLAYSWQFFTPIGFASHLRACADTYDIAHLHARRNALTAIAARRCARAGVPFVLSPHGTAPLIERRILAKRAFDCLAGRADLAGASRIVAVSEAERRQLLALGVAPARIAVIPNPVDAPGPLPDPGEFRRRHALGSRPVVLLLGKLTPRKGADVLLDAVQRLRHTLACLVVAGSDMGSGALDPRALAALEAAGRFRWIGLLRGAERFDALRAADVVVYPSRDEVFGLVPVEAVMCGTPVVVCNDSGCAEIVGGVGGGHIVPYGNADALAGAIDSILDSPATWRPRAKAAGDRARVSFDRAAICARIETLYREVLDSRIGSDRRTA